MDRNFENTQPILLFDGVCNLCNASVQLIIRIDKKGVLKFASLQSETGQTLLRKFNLPTENFKTLVLVTGDKYFVKSDVVLEISKLLGGNWRFFYVLKIIPKPIRDFLYSLVSKNRYKIWGKRDYCMMPTPELKQRFL